ncbi:MAG TPA: rod shape-determining protein MreC [Steroidobacteraceae bacterium]
MPGFAAGAYRPSPGRGTSPGFRFTLYAILAIVLMFVDQRRGWLADVRYVLSGAAYPLQLAVSSPTEAWRWLEQIFATRATLEAENAQLEREQQTLEMRQQRFEALARENGELRGLRDALPPVADHWIVAEVVEVELDSPRRRLLVNRGARNGVFKNQVVMDAHGLLGQTMRVGPWSAEVILITDPEHAVPVEIERTGVRTIALGTGETQALALPYLPANADVKSGDLLLTSGLGGVFPQGYPVARITDVRHDTVQPSAQVRARPLAQLDRMHEVMLVWFKGDHPAAPTPTATSASIDKNLPSGDPAYQPQSVPPRPKPTAPAASTTPAPKPAAHAASATPRRRPAGAAGDQAAPQPRTAEPDGSAAPAAAPAAAPVAPPPTPREPAPTAGANP